MGTIKAHVFPKNVVASDGTGPPVKILPVLFLYLRMGVDLHGVAGVLSAARECYWTGLSTIEASNFWLVFRPRKSPALFPAPSQRTQARRSRVRIVDVEVDAMLL
jgi:hypothetical protein